MIRIEESKYNAIRAKLAIYGHGERHNLTKMSEREEMGQREIVYLAKGERTGVLHRVQLVEVRSDYVDFSRYDYFFGISEIK